MDSSVYRYTGQTRTVAFEVKLMTKLEVYHDDQETPAAERRHWPSISVPIKLTCPNSQDEGGNRSPNPLLPFDTRG